jgi:hypothetical protein
MRIRILPCIQRLQYPSIVPLHAIMQGGASDPNDPTPAAPVTQAQQPQVSVSVAAAPGMVAFNPMQFWPQQAQAAAAPASSPAPPLGQSV